MERGKLAIPDDAELIEELSANQCGVASSDKIKIEPKDDIPARLGRSPDRADALAMCCEALAGRGGVPNRTASHW